MADDNHGIELVNADQKLFHIVDQDLTDLWLPLIGPTAYTVWNVLKRFTNTLERGTAFPVVTQRHWAERIGISQNTFNTAINVLEKHRLVKTIKKKGNTRQLKYAVLSVPAILPDHLKKNSKPYSKSNPFMHPVLEGRSRLFVKQKISFTPTQDKQAIDIAQQRESQNLGIPEIDELQEKDSLMGFPKIGNPNSQNLGIQIPKNCESLVEGTIVPPTVKESIKDSNLKNSGVTCVHTSDILEDEVPSTPNGIVRTNQPIPQSHQVKSDHEKLVDWFDNNRITSHPNLVKPGALTPSRKKNSLDEIDRLIRIDGFDFETEIKPTIEWAVTDPFWDSNLLALTRLRNIGSNGQSKFLNMHRSRTAQPTAGSSAPTFEAKLSKIKHPYYSPQEMAKKTPTEIRDLQGTHYDKKTGEFWEYDQQGNELQHRWLRDEEETA